MQDDRTLTVETDANSWGTAGFVMALIGWFTCGTISILGLIFSIIGLCSPGKAKGLAAAGLILSIPALFVFAFLGVWIFSSIYVLNTHDLPVAKNSEQSKETPIQQVERLRNEASARIERNSQRVKDELARIEREAEERNIPNPLVVKPREFVPLEQLYPEPPTVEPAAMAETPKAEEKPAPQPKLTRRTFTDFTGKHKINVFVIAYKDGWVKFRKVDEDAEQTLPVTRLSERDRKWLEENYVDRSKPTTLD